MKHTTTDIARIEEINDVTVRLHFTDGLTMRMSRKAYENGSWQKGTHKGLIVNIA
jgi:hypothetical protein